MATIVKVIVVGDDQASPALHSAAAAAEQVGTEAAAAAPQMESLAGDLFFVGEAAVQAGSYLTQMFTEPMGETLNIAGDVEQNLLRFSSVAGDALEEAGLQIDDLKELFIDLGQSTEFNANESAEAAVNLAKGGIDPAIIAAGGLATALDLAAAGELNLATAAEISAAQYGVWVDRTMSAAQQADLLRQNSDLLAQAANASTTDVYNLGLGLANVGDVGKLTGASFQEVVTTLALIVPGFQSASDAGTSLKTFFANLQPQTKSQIAAFRELNLLTEEGTSRFYDATGSFIGMEAAAELLHHATVGLSDAQRNQALGTIFGSDAIRAAARIAEEGADGYRRMTGDMLGAGSAAEQAAEKNQGFNFTLDTLRGSVETLAIRVGEQLLPPLTFLLNETIIPLVGFMGNLPGPVLAVVGGLGLLLAAAGPLMLVLGVFASSITAITGLFTTFSTLAPGFGAAWAVATGPVGLAVAGITALIATIGFLVYAWENNLGGMQTFFQGWGQNISEGWAVVTDNLVSGMATLGNYMQQGLGMVSNAVSEWGLDLQNGFGYAVDSVWAFVESTLDVLWNLPGNLLILGSEIVAGLWRGLSDAWNNLLDDAQNMAIDLVVAFQSALGISSPSDVMDEEVGFPSGEGAARGMRRSLPLVQDAGVMMRTTMLESMRSTPTMTSAANRDTITTTPVRSGEQREQHYHLHIHSSAPTEPIEHDFAFLRAWAGA